MGRAQQGQLNELEEKKNFLSNDVLFSWCPFCRHHHVCFCRVQETVARRSHVTLAAPVGWLPAANAHPRYFCRYVLAAERIFQFLAQR